MEWASDYIRELMGAALAENVGACDVSITATVSPLARGKARIVAEQDLVCAGLPLAEKVFQAVDPEIRIGLQATDGNKVEKGQTVLRLDGRAAGILRGEGTALYFLRTLSEIATLTQQYVEKLAGTRAKIRTTRNATPGLGLLEEYAVAVGGGTNRCEESVGGVLLKESHIAFVGGVKAALDQAHSYVSLQMRPRAMTAYEAVGAAPKDAEVNSVAIQIEVRNERELQEALSAGAESVLLEEMSVDEAGHFVRIVRQVRPDCVVEISGSMTLVDVRAYAETGADYLSPKALRQSAAMAEFRLLVDQSK
jgi:nicotinate-nucleotide pyrophosphorylase (carboxylating)